MELQVYGTVEVTEFPQESAHSWVGLPLWLTIHLSRCYL